MKLHLDMPGAEFRVTRHGAGWIEANGERHDCPVEICSAHCRRLEPAVASLDELTQAHLDSALALAPEVLLLGAGARHVRVPATLQATLHAAGVGVESMDTAAACRTYNVLVGEGRRVVALLL